jgi:hypothetical protein
MPNPFTFVRLSYHSGDWDAVDERMPANLLHSLVQYTKVPIVAKEKVVALDSPELFGYPFCYLSGHRLVQFSAAEKKNFIQYVRNGGFVFVDDCNHDIDGLFARSFEAQMAACFGPTALQKLPKTPDLPPVFHLQGWPAQHGLRAEWLGRRPRARLPQGRQHRRPPRGAVLQQGLWLRVGLRL